MSAYGVGRCDPLEQLQMDRIHGEYGRKDKSPGALSRDWAGVRALPLPKPFASAAFLSPTAMDDESLHDCFDRGPEEGDDRSFPLRLPREAAKPCRPKQI
jgi:hypothetical protein